MHLYNLSIVSLTLFTIFLLTVSTHCLEGFALLCIIRCISSSITVTLEMPRRPIAPRSTLAPHSFQNQIQSHPDDLQSTPLKGTKLSLFVTARLYSYSCVEIQRSTSSGKTEIVHRQGLASFQTLGSGGLEQLFNEYSLHNLTRELQTTA